MIVTREMDYAVRTLRALHHHGLLSAAAVAEREHMQKAITLKTLKQLHSGGLVESRRGVSGGYVLARSAEEMTLYDVFTAIGEPIYVNRCQREGYHCENAASGDCGACREFARIQAVLNEELRRHPLSDIFGE